jgi:hypothetical protein
LLGDGGGLALLGDGGGLALLGDGGGLALLGGGRQALPGDLNGHTEAVLGFAVVHTAQRQDVVVVAAGADLDEAVADRLSHSGWATYLEGDRFESVRGRSVYQVGARRSLDSKGFPPPPTVCIFRRMPRMQVYLPDDLHRAVKERGLPASELLQEAVRVELRRQDLLAATGEYLDELLVEVGQPTPEEAARAQAIARRLALRSDRVAG